MAMPFRFYRLPSSMVLWPFGRVEKTTRNRRTVKPWSLGSERIRRRRPLVRNELREQESGSLRESQYTVPGCLIVSFSWSWYRKSHQAEGCWSGEGARHFSGQRLKSCKVTRRQSEEAK
jgi:hypothetical protein